MYGWSDSGAYLGTDDFAPSPPLQSSPPTTSTTPSGPFQLLAITGHSGFTTSSPIPPTSGATGAKLSEPYHLRVDSDPALYSDRELDSPSRSPEPPSPGGADGRLLTYDSRSIHEGEADVSAVDDERPHHAEGVGGGAGDGPRRYLIRFTTPLHDAHQQSYVTHDTLLELLSDVESRGMDRIDSPGLEEAAALSPAGSAGRAVSPTPGADLSCATLRAWREELESLRPEDAACKVRVAHFLSQLCRSNLPVDSAELQPALDALVAVVRVRVEWWVEAKRWGNITEALLPLVDCLHLATPISPSAQSLGLLLLFVSASTLVILYAFACIHDTSSRFELRTARRAVVSSIQLLQRVLNTTTLTPTAPLSPTLTQPPSSPDLPSPPAYSSLPTDTDVSNVDERPPKPSLTIPAAAPRPPPPPAAVQQGKQWVGEWSPAVERQLVTAVLNLQLLLVELHQRLNERKHAQAAFEEAERSWSRYYPTTRCPLLEAMRLNVELLECIRLYRVAMDTTEDGELRSRWSRCIAQIERLLDAQARREEEEDDEAYSSGGRSEPLHFWTPMRVQDLPHMATYFLRVFLADACYHAGRVRPAWEHAAVANGLSASRPGSALWLARCWAHHKRHFTAFQVSAWALSQLEPALPTADPLFRDYVGRLRADSVHYARLLCWGIPEQRREFVLLLPSDYQGSLRNQVSYDELKRLADVLQGAVRGLSAHSRPADVVQLCVCAALCLVLLAMDHVDELTEDAIHLCHRAIQVSPEGLFDPFAHFVFAVALMQQRMFLSALVRLKEAELGPSARPSLAELVPLYRKRCGQRAAALAHVGSRQVALVPRESLPALLSEEVTGVRDEASTTSWLWRSGVRRCEGQREERVAYLQSTLTVDGVEGEHKEEEQTTDENIDSHSREATGGLSLGSPVALHVNSAVKAVGSSSANVGHKHSSSDSFKLSRDMRLEEQEQVVHWTRWKYRWTMRQDAVEDFEMVERQSNQEEVNSRAIQARVVKRSPLPQPSTPSSEPIAAPRVKHV